MFKPYELLENILVEIENGIKYGIKDKTIIFISHRLSTTKMADKIFMFDNGRLTESGSHDDLLNLGGKYAEMYRMQAEKYR
jgi:ATP-binding cassette subfamily B protein